MVIRQVLMIIVYVLIGCISSFVLNYILIENLIIPDPCYYHSHETTKVFDLFYEITSDEGYHPYPTKFNLIVTLIIGTILGLITKYWVTRK